MTISTAPNITNINKALDISAYKNRGDNHTKCALQL